MSRKSKVDSWLKVILVEIYLKDKIRFRERGRVAGLSDKTTNPFRRGFNIYQNEWLTGLLIQKKNAFIRKISSILEALRYLLHSGN